MLEWFNRYNREISMFVAGWCALGCLHNLADGDYIWAAVNALIVYLNIKFLR